MTSSTTRPAVGYPVRLDGRLDPATSRWQWLIKWLFDLGGADPRTPPDPRTPSPVVPVPAPA